MIIEEFKALRDEVKRCEAESLKITLFVFTGAVVAAGLSDSAWLPRLLVPTLFQIVLLWGMHSYHSLNSIRLRLSTYIETLIEPEVDGLNWERRNTEFNKLNYESYYFNNWLVSAVLHCGSNVFFLLQLLGLLLSVDAINTFDAAAQSHAWPLVTMLVLLHPMSFLFMMKCVFLKPKPDHYRQLWLQIQHEEAGP